MQPFLIQGVKAYSGASCTSNALSTGLIIPCSDGRIYYSALIRQKKRKLCFLECSFSTYRVETHSALQLLDKPSEKPQKPVYCSWFAPVLYYL